MKRLIYICAFLLIGCAPERKDLFNLEQTIKQDRKNVIFILSDDHRYDFIGFMGKVKLLETPNMDKLALQGGHLENAFVTTSLCSPSRASILTGQFSHHHGVVDNQSPVPDSAVFFPQYLQRAGYRTGFIGKWHMGESSNKKRRGFDYWASFSGQGNYYNPVFNVNGKEEAFTDSSYVTDLITGYATDFLDEAKSDDNPFFLYVSHKGVHADFQPAQRHKNKYEKISPAYPPNMFAPGKNPYGTDTLNYNYKDVPDWVKAQRYSWHGVDYMYHGEIDFDRFYKSYLETLLAVDESIGEIISYLEKNDLMKNTLVIYMGDNGFSFGEHGLIDKRQAYEESIRVPMMVYGSGVTPGSKISQLIQNIDVAPTILDYAGLKKPKNMDGMSFKPILAGEWVPWRDRIYYEYFWERPFPQTPTVHAVRTNQYKYMRYHGVWDINELYDLEKDPLEMNNLIRDPAHQEIAKALNEDLWKWLDETNGMMIPFRRDYGPRFDHKYRGTY